VIGRILRRERIRGGACVRVTGAVCFGRSEAAGAFFSLMLLQGIYLYSHVQACCMLGPDVRFEPLRRRLTNGAVTAFYYCPLTTLYD
jgi:hypothetical protein